MNFCRKQNTIAADSRDSSNERNKWGGKGNEWGIVGKKGGESMKGGDSRK